MSSIADKFIRVRKDDLREEFEERCKQVERHHHHWCSTPDIVDRILRKTKKAKHDDADCTKM